MGGWTTDEVGEWAGRRVVITGANSGIGLEAARVLVAHGAEVVLACRDEHKGAAAAASLTGPGRASAARLDLADLSSVRSFAGALAGERIDALVNNAGVMACPFATTADGLELQMGTNHFGHALLASLLLPQLAPEGRLVVVSSIAARTGRLSAATTLEDLTAPAPYSAQQVYSNTKQANLLYAMELHRRLAGSQGGPTVVACHPGVAATELFLRQLRDSHRGYLVPIVRPGMKLFCQSAVAGAWPTLRALSDPGLRGGEFVGPAGLAQTRGRPVLLEVYPTGRDEQAAARLFELTEEVLGLSLTGGLA